MNILIIGAGAIGCLVGGKLAQSGATLTLVGRPRLAEIIQRQGLVLRDPQGNSTTVDNMRIVGTIAKAFASGDLPYDLAIFTVKSYATEETLAELVADVQATSSMMPLMLSLQNGVGNEEAMATAVGAANVLAGSITTPVSVVQPGVIQVEKAQFSIGLGAWQPALVYEQIATLQHVFQNAGFTVQIYPDAACLKWTKLLMNLVGNATSAILDEAPTALFADPALVDVEIEALRETLRVMRQARIKPVNFGRYRFKLLAPLIQIAPKPLLRQFLRAQTGARGDKMPSLQIDLNAGKGQSEVGWLNGAVVRTGQAIGVATPVNQVLTDTLLNLVQGPEQRASWRNNHARLLAALAEKGYAR